jgi:hypothetical protein
MHVSPSGQVECTLPGEVSTAVASQSYASGMRSSKTPEDGIVSTASRTMRA